jgi:hypothetical protein
MCTIVSFSSKREGGFTSILRSEAVPSISSSEFIGEGKTGSAIS